MGDFHGDWREDGNATPSWQLLKSHAKEVAQLLALITIKTIAKSYINIENFTFKIFGTSQ